MKMPIALEWTEETALTVAQHTRENQQHKYGKHSYDISDFGLTAEGVNSRFGDYIKTYLGQGQKAIRCPIS